MLQPKKVKYRRWQRMRSNKKKVGVATRGTEVNFGQYGLKAKTEGCIRSEQIEAARRVISRNLGKTGRTWIRIFPDRPWTQKANEVGMGKGKGNPEGFEFRVKPGRVLFEVSGVSEEVAKDVLIRASKKLPVTGMFVIKN